jgi:hypothetical protein|nr:MAG TPA: hypothetical protein [Caudoviricetes sp.]
MLEGFTEEELQSMAYDCQKKYEKLEKETVMKALTGEIGTNSAMVEELESLNIRYHDEMDEYDDTALDLNPGLIENFKRAEREGKNVILEAQEYLKILGMCEEMFNQKMWVNEDGHMCDEDGNRLSADGEHRVFEVIKGGKQDN